MPKITTVTYNFSTGEKATLDLNKMDKGVLSIDWEPGMVLTMMMDKDSEYYKKCMPYLMQQAANILNKRIGYVGANKEPLAYDPNSN